VLSLSLLNGGAPISEMGSYTCTGSNGTQSSIMCSQGHIELPKEVHATHTESKVQILLVDGH